MKKRFLSIGLTALSILSILMLTLSSVQTRGTVSAATSPQKTFAGNIPSSVKSGQARLIGHHLGTNHLALAIGLSLRNEQALTQLLNEVSTPRNPQYRHYLTQTQANQAFNPTPQQEQQVIVWLQAHGLTVTHTYPNHLLVDVTGTVAQIEHLFQVTINDYTMQLEGKQTTFYAPSNEPTVDGSVSNVIDSILGLDDYPSFQVNDSLAPTRPTGNGTAHGSPPYYPQDFANAYDVNPLWNAGYTGAGQHIGIILWAPPPSSAALQLFDAKTGAQQPNLQLKLVDGGSNSTAVAPEAGLDVESASGMAPGATIDYYEAPRTPSGLDDALNMAGTDTNNFANAQISNSWYGSDGRYWSSCEAANLSDPFTMKTEQIFQSNTATGHDYLFSSGDYGSACVPNPNHPCTTKDPYPQYPASSAYVTSVGGTRFNGKINGGYPGEVAWHYMSSACPNPPYLPAGSGGGYSRLFAQPSWQAGFSKNKHRGYPDVAADADKYTGALVCFDGKKGPSCGKAGGTSLAAPLWAGMIADVNQYVQSQNKQPLGFINPLLYTMSKGSPYTAYHDITKGTNRKYNATQGWDAVTGLGSPDLYNLARDAASLDLSNDSSLTGIATVSATDVWAVGSYTNSNGDSLTLIEHWNGTGWKVVPSPNPGSGPNNNNLFSVAAVSATDVWAVGSYYNSNGDSLTLIEHWNGAGWKVVPSPNPPDHSQFQDAQLSGVTAVSATDVWAVGSYTNSGGVNQTLIEHWNGTNWNVIPSPNPGSSCPGGFCNDLSSVMAVSATDVWAVGYYNNSSGNDLTLIEQWNGTNWNVVPSPNPGLYSNDLYSVAAASATDVWAVGSYYNSNGDSLTLIEQWNGTNWNVIPSPNPSGQYQSVELNSVAAVSATDVWAVGFYNNQTTLIEQWNGTSWNVVPSPNLGPYRNGLFSVAAVSATDVWAVGFYNNPSGNYAQTLTAQWNGSTWNVVPSP